MIEHVAIVIQSMHLAPVSGVAFGQDPRGLNKNHEIIEAVSGKCSKLVNAEVDPDIGHHHYHFIKIYSAVNDHLSHK